MSKRKPQIMQRANLGPDGRAVSSVRSEYRKRVGDIEVVSIVQVNFIGSERFTADEMKSLMADVDGRPLPIVM